MSMILPFVSKKNKYYRCIYGLEINNTGVSRGCGSRLEDLKRILRIGKCLDGDLA